LPTLFWSLGVFLGTGNRIFTAIDGLSEFLSEYNLLLDYKRRRLFLDSQHTQHKH
jgi:hypothetical protein